MRAKRKETKTYYFSVEGETEKRYLDWLQKEINQSTTATYNVKLDSKVEKSPVSRIKGLNITQSTEITHVFDFEGTEKEDVSLVQTTLDAMRDAESKGKSVKYHLGYSNFTFELWLILHKADCNTSLTDRGKYLAPLNRAYEQNFKSLKEYKREDNFQHLLESLTISDVIEACLRAEKITNANNSNAGSGRTTYKKYTYHQRNPSLSIHRIIAKILKDCGLDRGLLESVKSDWDDIDTSCL